MLYRSITILLTLSIIFSCKEKSNLTYPDIPEGLVSFNYDDGNLDAPALPEGSFESVVKFPISMLQAYKDKEIKEIHFYIKELPNVCMIKLYSSFPGQNSPSDLLYSKNVISDIDELSWNLHVLDPPVIIGEKDLWVSVAFKSNRSNNRIVGCDPGPAVENGDWIWDEQFGKWNYLRNVSDVNINWNIRMAVDPD